MEADRSVPPVKITAPAETPRKPARPDIALNLLLGLAAGIVLGIAGAFAMDGFDSGFRSVQDVESRLRVPVMAVIPRQPFGRGMDEAQARAVLAAVYKSLCAHVRLWNADGKSKCVAFASAEPLAGKTSAALNCAVMMAQPGSKVALLDLDMRKPSIHKLLGAEKVPGVSAVVLGKVSWRSAALKVALDRLADGKGALYAIPAGDADINPMELLRSRAASDLVKELKTEFDYVIADTPSMVSAPDVSVFADKADGVIFVCRAGRSDASAAANAVAELNAGSAKVFGAVLNGVKPARGADKIA